MRRLPIYFVIDVSESMAGEPIRQVQEGMDSIIQGLCRDPYALETAHISVIAFAGRAKVLSPLEEVFQFSPPKLPIGGGTSLGAALECLMDDMDRSLRKTTREVKGDWKPIVFLFTDGVPTDDPSRAIKKWNASYRKRCSLVAVSLGRGADTGLLAQLTDDVLRLNNVGKEGFREFFKWVTASIAASSASAADTGDDSLKLPPTDGINLEKAGGSRGGVDDNFIVLRCKCSSTKRQYLIKFGKDAPRDGTEYGLIGAYEIDGEQYEALSSGESAATVKSDRISGMPSCPCCEARAGFITCGACGRASCWNGGATHTCPWCGARGEVTCSDSALDLARGRG